MSEPSLRRGDETDESSTRNANKSGARRESGVTANSRRHRNR